MTAPFIYSYYISYSILVSHFRASIVSFAFILALLLLLTR